MVSLDRAGLELFGQQKCPVGWNLVFYTQLWNYCPLIIAFFYFAIDI